MPTLPQPADLAVEELNLRLRKGGRDFVEY